MGSSDGLFKDMQFFECEKDCAVFVALDRLSRNASVIAKPSTSANSGNDSTGSSANKKPKNLQKQKSVELQQKQTPFRIGDRVDTFDDYGGTVKGTVKWTGGNATIVIVGIETVSEFIYISLHGQYKICVLCSC